MRIVQALIATIALICCAACQKPATSTAVAPQAPAGSQEYTVRGILRAINFADNSVTVEHEEVPEYMPAMTMPFDVKNMTEVQPLKAGDGMQFKLVVTEKTSWIQDVQKIDPAEVKIEKPRKAFTEGGIKAERVKEGDSVPDFKLVDQNGTEISAETFRGKPFLLTFIFTRCPVPNFCPLMSRNFSEIQSELKDEPALAANVSYLSISFDPEFDTPEVLKKYAEQYHADGKQWRFATGTKEQIKALTEAFSVYVQPEQGTISHGLVTAIVSGDGKVVKLLRGNGWQPQEAVTELKKLNAASAK